MKTFARFIFLTTSYTQIPFFLDSDYYEVGNLLIASKFQVDGTGTVNLTWEVPNEMRSKINGKIYL
jgi:hypothetical protein